ncbi:MAG: LPS export ABC transporter ATP-binding protein [Luminiphilus sp.]|nr:LPS export ABC transporter ATP-binding protein [Luminiphilus sp.]
MSRRLEANDLTKSYRGRRVVDGISLAVEQGEIVGLLGPNGAGKTTSFYLIVGLVSADSGTIGIDSQDITSLPIHRRAQQGLGYLPQEASVFRQLSVKENLMAILETRKDLSTVEQLERCETLMREFHITHLADALGQALSGGERRRVEIARALATEPDFILLDEPFAGVDPISIADIKGIISHLKDRGIGVLITDHNVRETLDICERAYIVNAGKVIAEGDSAAVMDNAEVRKVYLGENFRL